MEAKYPQYWPQFYTATVQDWKPLFSTVVFKQMIVESLQFLVAEKRIVLNAFVIMSNHIHLIWQPLSNETLTSIQSSFMKYTARGFKKELESTDKLLLESYQVKKGDRKYQFWKRDSLSIELRTASVFAQKLEYIHYNPVWAGLCKYPEEYYFSSARFYHVGNDEFKMLAYYSRN